jgi:hypothetical protein
VRRFVAPLAAVVLLAALPPAASAGERTKKDKGGVAKGGGLSTKERKALDIASMRVYAQQSIGLVAVVKFKGNIEKALGRGHLKNGAVALILNPKPGKGSPAGIVTKGGELTDEVDTRTRSKTVGAIRDGRRLTFFIKGPGAKSVKSVEVRTFARAPRRGRARKSDDLGLLLFIAYVQSQLEADEEFVFPDVTKLSCEELRDLIEDLIEAGEEVQDDLDDVEDERGFVAGELLREDLPADRRRELEKEREDLRDEYIELLDEQEDLADMFLEAAQEFERRCGTGPIVEVLTGVFEWSRFDANEVVMRNARFTLSGGLQGGPYVPYSRDVFAAAPSDPITAIRVVVPPQGNTERVITGFLCPTQLPNPALATTTNPSDTLVCSGGSLPVNQNFNVNVRTAPPPSDGMGGQIFAQQEGQLKGPFAITGP